MPYIKKITREFIDHGAVPLDAGELNYAITRLCHLYIKTHDQRYQVYNDVLGALEGAKLELYRRKVAPYEDVKMNENGDL